MMCNRRGKIGIRNRQCHQNKPSTTYLFCRASQAIAIQRTRNSVFLQDIHTELICPEYNGFNTRRYVGQPPCFLNPRLQGFLPPIDPPPPPAHHDTIKTEIDKCFSLMRAAVKIYSYSRLTSNFKKSCSVNPPIPVLGGIHRLMNNIVFMPQLSS